MKFPIITADERMAERQGVKLVLLGKSGLGKTTQLKTLPEDSTLFVDLEAGDLAVKDWRGDAIRPKTGPEFRDLAVFLAGPNPALAPDAPFSQAHFDHVCTQYGDPAQLTKYETYFVDSITVLSRMCLTWAKSQPAAFSEKTGKPDTRGAYGLLGTEMIGALTHLQHARGKNVIFVAILDELTDEFNRKQFAAQIEGAKTTMQLPGIVDEVITLAELKTDAGDAYRAFVCHTVNPWSYPAKDRSGQLEMIEPPHLGQLIAKCAQAQNSASRAAVPLATAIPEETPSIAEQQQQQQPEAQPATTPITDNAPAWSQPVVPTAEPTQE